MALVCQKLSVRYQVRPGQGQKKFLVGGGGVVCLIIVSALGPGLSKVKLGLAKVKKKFLVGGDGVVYLIIVQVWQINIAVQL